MLAIMSEKILERPVLAPEHEIFFAHRSRTLGHGPNIRGRKQGWRKLCRNTNLSSSTVSNQYKLESRRHLCARCFSHLEQM